MATTTKRIPVCRAKTAYGVLAFVRRLILEEPKRYVQERFIIRQGGAGGADDFVHPVFQDSMDDEAPGIERPLQIPACGTAGCVAGWVATVVDGPVGSYVSIAGRARAILGIESDQGYELFSVSAISRLVPEGKPIPAIQTPAYAKLGAKHITNFMKKYAAQLRTTKVTR